MAYPDFDAEGLLSGLDRFARGARLELLEQLYDDGVSLEALRRAVAEERLVLLPVERAIAGERRYTLRDVAELTGLSLELLERQRLASGTAADDPDEKALNDAELESAHRTARFIQAGMDEAVLDEIARTVGVAMHQVAATLVEVMSRALLEPGIDEALLAQRYATAAQQLLPDFGQTLETVLRRHLLDDITQSVLTDADRLAGVPTRTRAVAIGFADLVGFTRLGERVAPDELSEIADRFTHQAAELARPPVRLVKTIGDAVMLVSPDVAPLLEVLMILLDELGEGLHAGMAFGEAVDHRGDYFGRPVNLASRVCGVANPGSLLTTAEVRHAVTDERYDWSKAGMRRLKNVKGTTALWRVRRAQTPTRRSDAASK